MHEQTLALLERLLAATRENRIQWSEVTGKTAFSYRAGDYVLVIDANNARASFRLSDGHGRTLDEADESDLNSAPLAFGGTALDAVHEMHAVAKRQAIGTDTAIASVMEHLQSLESTKGGAKNEAEPKDHDQAPGAAPQQAAAPEQAQAEQAHPGEGKGAGEAEGGEPSAETDTAHKKRRSLFHPFGGKK